MVTFHRITLQLDSFLVVRAFELWTHEEDIRRAVDCAPADPEPDILSRMTALAVPLLPAGVAAVGATADRTARLVLVGAGGGTWDVPSPALPAERHRGTDPRRPRHRRCRRLLPGRRQPRHLESSDAVVHGDRGVARAVLAAAAALALD